MTAPLAGRPIDSASVEIEPNLRDFERRLRRDLDDAFRTMLRQVLRATERVEEDFREAGRSISRSFEQAEHSVAESLDDVADEARDAGRAIALDIATGAEVAQHAVDDMADHAVRDLRRVQRVARDTGRSFITNIRETSTSVFDTLNRLRQNLLGLGTVLPSPLITLILALIPAILGLAGALGDLIGLIGVLPAGIGFLVTTIAPLILAFQGLGEAVEAVVSKDPEKIKEALSGLAPAARGFVREIQALLKPLGELQDAVQEAFFRPLKGVLTTLVRESLPTLRTGLTGVASSLGTLFAGVGKMLADPDILEAIGDVFESTARIITQVGPGLIEFLGTFFGLMEHGLPFLERIMAGFVRQLNSFTKMLSEGMRGEGFNEFIEDALSTLKELGRLAGSVFRLFGALMGPLDDAGRDLIHTLGDIIDRFTEWLGTVEGQRFIEDLIVAIVATGRALGYLVNALIFTIEFSQKLADAVYAVIRWFNRAGMEIAAFFRMLGDWVNAAVTWFQRLPGMIGAALAALPGMILNFFVFLFDQVTTGIGFGIGRITRFFAELPAQILALIKSLPGRAAATFEQLRAVVVSIVADLWNRVVAFFAQAPGRAQAAISSLPARIKSVLLSLASSMYSVGQAIIQGMINGIVSMITSAIDIGKRAVSNIISGIRRGLGIASPSRVAAELIGRPIIEGIGVGMRDETPSIRDILDQLVPIGIGGNENNTVHNTPVSVTVNFVGGAPSEQEALTAGRAVGEGIAATLAARAVRTQVRTT